MSDESSELAAAKLDKATRAVKKEKKANRKGKTTKEEKKTGDVFEPSTVFHSNS
jgi:hypothetical protein